jgi:YjjG family noncanonical pyrimidine nucleotidase
MTRYRWLLFDADNTLFDFDRAEAGALRLTFEQVGIAFEPAHLTRYQQVNRLVWQALEAGTISSEVMRVRRFELLFDALGILADADRFSAAYLPNLAAQSTLTPDALDVVRTLSARCRLAIITNGLADVQRPRLEQSAIRGYIDAIVISDEVGAAKPQPAIFDTAFDRMGGPRRDEVLMIGDSLASDIAGGVGYGIETCWYNPAALAPADGIASTYEIRRLPELLDLV